MADWDADHPYSPVRAYEAMKWEKTETCNWLRSNEFKLEFPEDKRSPQKVEDKSRNGWSIPSIPKNVDLKSVIPNFKGFKK